MKKPNAPESIAIVVLAVAGAQLPGMLGPAQKATALKCEEVGRAFSNAWHGATQAEPGPGEPIDSYYDVRHKREMPAYRDGEAPTAPHVWQGGKWVEGTAAPAATTPMPPAAPKPAPVAPEAAPLLVPPPAPPVGSWEPISAQSEMIQTISGTMTEDQYQAFRRQQ